MKKHLRTGVCVLLALCFALSYAQAAEKRQKFGADKRSEVAKKVVEMQAYLKSWLGY